METQPQPASKPQVIPLPIVLSLGALVLCLILGGGGTAYYYYGPCGVNRVNAASAVLIQEVTRFQDASKVALATSRIQLAGPVADMQEIRRASDAVAMPACMAYAHALTVDGMDAATNGMLAFMSEASNHDVAVYFEQANQSFQAATDELDRLDQCVPFCADPAVTMETLPE
jgi:hypothetical protein